MDSSYKSVLDYLHTQLPMFQRVGAPAYKADLSRTQVIMGLVGNPQKQFKSIHVAGTNGKGSVCSALAAIFTTCGYRTGLYTSPHLFDFRERMRIDGQMIDRDFVIHFVETIKESTAELRSSYTNFENSFTIVILDGFSYPCHSFTPPPSTPSEPRGSWVSQSLLRFG